MNAVRAIQLALKCAAVCALLALFAPVAYAGSDSGRDFVAEAVLFYRAVACGDTGAGKTPAAPGDTKPADSALALDAASVAAHCKYHGREVALFRDRYVARALPFFSQHRPEDLPKSVVYPFGGGDLISALVTYPDASEITTISLEHAGDPRRLARLSPARLRTSLAQYRAAISGLLQNHDSASVKLKALERGPVPGQLSFFIQALAVMGYEPVSLKFFRIEPDGSLHYYTGAEIAELEGKKARRKATRWIDTDYSIAFSNMELGFRKPSSGASSGGDRKSDRPIKIHRHIAANLSDDHFPTSPLAKHLAAKGKVAAMTKAASYLLWSGYFSQIRKYLLDNMVFMVSDSTGIPPFYARKAGFEQITFGRFTGAFLKAPELHDKAFQRLWKSQPHRPLRFRYGYWDPAKNRHLVITRRKP